MLLSLLKAAAEAPTTSTAARTEKRMVARRDRAGSRLALRAIYLPARPLKRQGTSMDVIRGSTLHKLPQGSSVFRALRVRHRCSKGDTTCTIEYQHASVVGVDVESQRHLPIPSRPERELQVRAASGHDGIAHTRNLRVPWVNTARKCLRLPVFWALLHVVRETRGLLPPCVSRFVCETGLRGRIARPAPAPPTSHISAHHPPTPQTTTPSPHSVALAFAH